MESQSTGISGQASTNRAERGPDIGFPHDIGSGLSQPLIDRIDQQTISVALVGSETSVDSKRSVTGPEVRTHSSLRQLLTALGHGALTSK